ncbi:MAG: SpoIVB peptidase [Acetobacter sp.]|nr:SpoIVB peptidase [Bacteroides sp.]MCM1342095.1 SpoIVB peptidase [Acetobacter sp.]MCM1434327.1 SpoIVB peptidase [Clostridiales bacterium]
MKKIIRIGDAVISVCVAVIMIFVTAGNFILPDSVSTYSNKDIRYFNIYNVSAGNENFVDYQNNSMVSSRQEKLKLFGIIPVKSTKLSQGRAKQVAVSGESFGIKLYTDGVIVVGTKDIEADDGKHNPASEAGIEKGDIIVSINDEKTVSSEQVEQAFNDNNGNEYRIKVKRNGNYKSFTLKPIYSKSEGRYKVGIWVRDSTAGIGTITFFNQDNQTVAALGHPINDVDTNEIMPILNGEAVEANVTKLYKSINGETGSLCCDFTNNVIGTLSLNSRLGVYGKYVSAVNENRIMEIAPSHEIEKGPAKVLCTVDDKGPQYYDVEITRISYKANNNEKNMVVKVTDKNLIEKTGGIVQGMSGSPIVQNGKLVGALTHVIIDNPEKGYAVFAEKMVEESYNVS